MLHRKSVSHCYTKGFHTLSLPFVTENLTKETLTHLEHSFFFPIAQQATENKAHQHFVVQKKKRKGALSEMFAINTVCAGLSGGTAGEGLLITKPGHSTRKFSNFCFPTQ